MAHVAKDIADRLVDASVAYGYMLCITVLTEGSASARSLLKLLLLGLDKAMSTQRMPGVTAWLAQMGIMGPSKQPSLTLLPASSRCGGWRSFQVIELCLREKA